MSDGETRRSRHRREVFERLVQAAREVVLSQGLQEGTVQEITDMADVGKGTFFTFFKTKEHVVVQFFEDAVERLKKIPDGETASDVPVIQQLNSQFTSQDDRDHGEAWLNARGSILRTLILREDVRQAAAPLVEELRTVIADILRIGQARGEIDRDLDPSVLALLFQSVLYGIQLVKWLEHRSLSPSDSEALLAILWKRVESVDANQHSKHRIRRNRQKSSPSNY